jgi:dipeptidyl aminopeptidase/acylaminoacyl peptidase
MRRLAFSMIVGAIWGCATPGAAVARTPAPAPETAAPASDVLTAEDVVSLAMVSSVAVSPDGKRIAYVLRTPRQAMDAPGSARSVIWLIDRKGGAPVRFTAPDASSWSPQWSPDGRWLGFLSSRAGDDAAQIYKISPRGGEPERVTEFDGGVRSFAWSPDGKAIAYLTKRTPTKDEREATEAGHDWRASDVKGDARRLFVLELASGKSKAVSKREFHVERFVWAPDSKRLLLQAGERADVDAVMMYSKLFVADRKGGWTPLTQTAGKLGDFAWSPDGKSIAFLGASDLHDPTAGVVHVVPATGGEARAVTPDFAGTGQWLEWADDGTLVMLANEGTKTTVSAVDPGTGKVRPLLRGGPVCEHADIDPKGKLFACAGSTGAHPAELYVGALRRGRLARLTRSNPGLPNEKLGAQEVITWKAEDGLPIEGVLIKPVGYEAGKRYRLVVLVHGGPEGITHDGWNTRAGYPAQLFASRGFVVLMPNYRGSNGRGVAFGKSDQKDLGGKEFEDVLAGIDHLAAEGLVDPKRVGMGGWSYGGYFSALAATKHSERFKAAMVGAAITNWISFTGTTEIEHENSLVHWNLWPYENFELAWERSPMAHASKSKTATLIVHGESDTRVPPGQATELFRALRHFGVRTEIVLYPREGHGLGERAHQLDFAQRFVDWFDEHV